MLKAALLIALLLLVLLGVWLWTPDKPRSELAQRYLREAADMRTVLGVRLHVRDTGPVGAPALLMIHGFGSSLHTWEAWARGLEDTYRVVRLDLPGSGLSHPDPSGDYSDARTLELLAALMDELGIGRATLVGNSVGGRIAWRFAAGYPERVSGLVLVSPDGFASEGFTYGEAPKVGPVVNIMRYVLPRALLASSLKPAYGDPTLLEEDVITRYHDLMLAPGSRQAIIQRMAQTVLVDPRPLLQRITVPVLLLWGEEDGMIPVDNAADYLEQLPDGRLVALPGLGHVPHEEAPERTLVPLRAYLEALP